MNIRRVPIKKLWHGFVSLRSYIYEEAKRNGEAIRFELLDGRTMTVPWEKLDNHIKNGFEIKSKQIMGQVYDLYDYDFKADFREVQEQLL